MAGKLAEVKVAYESNYRDVSAMMKKLACRIESGELKATSAVCVIDLADGPMVFGWGDAEQERHALLAEAGSKFIKECSIKPVQG